MHLVKAAKASPMQNFTIYRIYSSISHIFLFQNIAKKVMCDLYTNISSALYATQNFSEIFSCYCFLCYRLSYDRVTYRLSTRVTLHCIFLPPSWDADEDVPEVSWDYSRTVTAVMTSIVFNFL